MNGIKLKKCFPEIADAIIKEAEEAYNGMLILPGTMGKRFFVGNPIKWEDNPVGNKEYTYSLNRMGCLKVMAEAYTITGDEKYKNRVTSELRRWTDTVLPPSIDDVDAFSECSPWRALEVGGRGYNAWPVIIDAIPECRDILRESAAKHMEIIYNVSPKLWPKANHNHYLIENLGLLSFSVTYPELDKDQKYRNHAIRELGRCLKAQVTAEGAQIEGCPSYHNACLSLFALKSFILHEPIPLEIEKMYEHSIYSTMNIGGNFAIGDSHVGDNETVMLPSVSLYLATGDRSYLSKALHFDNSEMLMKEIAATIHRFNDYDKLKEDINAVLSEKHIIDLPLCAFQKSVGECFIRTGWEKEDISLSAIARSPIQNNHAHIDPLSFILTAFGKAFIMDPGIYTYKEGEDRYRYKSTRSHSTISINGKDAWQYISSWKYGPQKKSCIDNVAEIDGYHVIKMESECYENAIIKRTMALQKSTGILVIVDDINGLSDGDYAEVSFNVNSLSTVTGGRILYSEDPDANIKIETSKGILRTESCFYSPILDIENKTTMLRCRVDADGSSLLIPTVITPYKADMPEDAEILEEKGRITIKTGNLSLVYEKGEIHRC